jgi:hypothetical protein
MSSSEKTIVLGIATGRCGTASLAAVLAEQPDAMCSHEESPILPWRPMDGRRTLQERFARFRAHGAARFLGDVASSYLPYLDDAIALEPDIRIVCLRRPREEVVEDFSAWLDRTMPLPVNHWARQPSPGWHHDPIRTRTYPQYDTQDRREGITTLVWLAQQFTDTYLTTGQTISNSHGRTFHVWKSIRAAGLIYLGANYTGSGASGDMYSVLLLPLCWNPTDNKTTLPHPATSTHPALRACLQIAATNPLSLRERARVGAHEARVAGGRNPAVANVTSRTKPSPLSLSQRTA